MAFTGKDKKKGDGSKKSPNLRCTFMTAGRRCQIYGGHTDHGPDNRLCDWHWLYQHLPKLLQDYEEFVRYRNKERETYAKEWLHSLLYVDDDLVWAAC